MNPDFGRPVFRWLLYLTLVLLVGGSSFRLFVSLPDHLCSQAFQVWMYCLNGSSECTCLDVSTLSCINLQSLLFVGPIAEMRKNAKSLLFVGQSQNYSNHLNTRHQISKYTWIPDFLVSGIPMVRPFECKTPVQFKLIYAMLVRILSNHSNSWPVSDLNSSISIELSGLSGIVSTIENPDYSGFWILTVFFYKISTFVALGVKVC